ncbi:metallophosphoesterase [Halobacillus karajensis]|uniref:Metallophosphoesterase n=1 Tax=Halobacillus karajensis TaxID=195088 RepID=A0A024P2W4_9BACI|nr:metallophosphoesterase [Halobacillus karajensis]CDQ19470.1 putative metallophosphoesterase [Halobacillus karajensis]CDQ21932.1 putative metallophosphoesterase [Halobacillus karajensis]CDQ27773.1 putative metallophosphoesterase [Halobacillus karajensis]
MWWLLLFLCLLGSILVTYMRFCAEHDHLNKKKIICHSLKRNETLRLFFISDIHNRALEAQTFNDVEHVDLVIIGGDLVDQRTTERRLRQNLSILSQWGAPIYFVPGNNDHEWRYGSLIDFLEGLNVKTISNEDQFITFENGIKIMVRGLDPYFMKPYNKASDVKGTNDLLQILCVHDPYVFKRMNQKGHENFDLVLSGHTHGGQIRIFGYGPYERGGWKAEGGRSSLISEGYGTSLLPLRLGTKAECHWIELTSNEE